MEKADFLPVVRRGTRRLSDQRSIAHLREIDGVGHCCRKSLSPNEHEESVRSIEPWLRGQQPYELTTDIEIASAVVSKVYDHTERSDPIDLASKQLTAFGKVVVAPPVYVHCAI